MRRTTLTGLVAEGFGLTFLPEIALQSETPPGLALRRFASPEPARTLALVHRDGSEPADWAGDLADILRASGRELLSHARGAGRG